MNRIQKLSFYRKNVEFFEGLKDGDDIWLKKNCAKAHKFWCSDMKQDCIVTLKDYNGSAFHIVGSIGLYVVHLIDIKRTKKLQKQEV